MVKRLWKHQVKRDEGDGASQGAVTDDDDDVIQMKAVAHSMLKRLKEKQLEALVQAVESRGGDTTSCVVLPREPLQLGKRTVQPHVVCCRLWRWPRVDAPLKPVPVCTTMDSADDICCNPYHWSHCILPGIQNVDPLLLPDIFIVAVYFTRYTL